MASFELKIHGAAELAAKLRAMPVKLERKALQEAVDGAMDDVLPEMRVAVPPSSDQQSPDSKKYGRTKDNIRVVKIKKPGRDKKGARIDTGNAFWQLYYNFGTRYQPARPWFAQRFRSLAQKVVDRFGERVGKSIEELWAQK